MRPAGDEQEVLLLGGIGAVDEGEGHAVEPLAGHDQIVSGRRPGRERAERQRAEALERVARVGRRVRAGRRRVGSAAIVGVAAGGRVGLGEQDVVGSVPLVDAVPEHVLHRIPVERHAALGGERRVRGVAGERLVAGPGAVVDGRRDAVPVGAHDERAGGEGGAPQPARRRRQILEPVVLEARAGDAGLEQHLAVGAAVGGERAVDVEGGGAEHRLAPAHLERAALVQQHHLVGRETLPVTADSRHAVVPGALGEAARAHHRRDVHHRHALVAEDEGVLDVVDREGADQRAHVAVRLHAADGVEVAPDAQQRQARARLGRREAAQGVGDARVRPRSGTGPTRSTARARRRC